MSEFTPPADDVREAEADAALIRLEDAISNIDYPGSDSTEWEHKAKVAAKALRAMVRPRGVVTEADVDDAVERIRARLSYASLHWGAEGLHPDALPHIARAALEAARGVHP